jgi:dTDP-4-amino-4,6-dideoxygalactose transaminase
MSVPFLDLRQGYLELKAELDGAVARVLDAGWYILGPEVEAFEAEFAAYCGAQYSVGVANGLNALHLALLALGVSAGDEVIVPSNTYIATWLAVSQCGAVPVPVEPDQQTFNIDPARIEAAITTHTRVIMPVHLHGMPADIDPILAIARRHGLKVVEDAAQAHGARYKGRRVGAHGDIVAWSFYPSKNLGAFGDGGAITTNSADIADRIRVLRNYGSREKYTNEILGFNSRLDTLQAAILRVKLAYLEQWNARRRAIANLYQQELGRANFCLPQVPDWAEPVYHLYVIRHPRRDDLQRALGKAGVGTFIHYPIPPHLQEAYRFAGWSLGAFPIAERLADEVLSLPMGPHLSIQQAEAVVDAMLRADAA